MDKDKKIGRGVAEEGEDEKEETKQKNSSWWWWRETKEEEGKWNAKKKKGVSGRVALF